MFSLQRLLGREDVFFDLLEKSANEARESVRTLTRLLASPGTHSLDEFATLRVSDKKITEELHERISRTFVTPLEREDLDALATALYKIPKTLEKFAERMLIAPQRFRPDEFTRQAELIEQAVDLVVALVGELRHGSRQDAVRDTNSRLQLLETRADDAMTELLRRLYTEPRDPVTVVMLKDLYDLLEKVMDRCRDAGAVVVQIMLKNS